MSRWVLRYLRDMPVPPGKLILVTTDVALATLLLPHVVIRFSGSLGMAMAATMCQPGRTRLSSSRPLARHSAVSSVDGPSLTPSNFLR
jgi:hypothetical protein